jgi:carboxyl-terminal processing protease
MLREHRFLLWVCIPVFTLALGWQLGVRFEGNRAAAQQQAIEQQFLGGTASGAVVTDPERQVDLSVFWQVWHLLLNHYIQPQDLKATPMLMGAVQGMVAAIGDPYTVFMPPEQTNEFHDALSGALQGIGAELSMKDGDVTVVSPLKGSPAQKAGLLPGDVILAVDDKSTDGMTLPDVVSHIRGKKGTHVKLTIGRSGHAKPLTLTITREDITVPSVEHELKKTASGSVGYIAINQFGDDTVQEVTAAAQDLMHQHMDSLLIDLRFNGGGYLDGAVDLSSMFLKEGKVVSVKQRDGDPANHYVSGNPLLPEIPMAILINGGSASASEIFAGAMQDYGRAKIIGVKSFGKGTVQEVIDLPGGSSLRVTIAHWFTPKGRNLAKEGITPDIVIDRTDADIAANRDPQLAAAETWLTQHRDITAGQKTGSGDTMSGAVR